jgi:hypothetical protein
MWLVFTIEFGVVIVVSLLYVHLISNQDNNFDEED